MYEKLRKNHWAIELSIKIQALNLIENGILNV